MKREKLSELIKNTFLKTDNNWVSVLNDIEKETTERTLDMYYNKIVKEDNMYNNIIADLYEAQEKIHNLSEEVDYAIYDLDGLKKHEKIQKLFIKAQELTEKLNEGKESILGRISNCQEIVNTEFANNIRDILRSYTTKIEVAINLTNNRKEYVEFRRRVKLLDKKVDDVCWGNLNECTISTHVVNMYLDNKSRLDNIITLLLAVTKKMHKDIERELKQFNRNKKIFDYKEMFKLAEQLGYMKERVAGDHFIFRHNKTNKIVPIPRRTIGYGLMCDIQRQIKANARIS